MLKAYIRPVGISLWFGFVLGLSGCALVGADGAAEGSAKRSDGSVDSTTSVAKPKPSSHTQPETEKEAPKKSSWFSRKENSSNTAKQPVPNAKKANVERFDQAISALSTQDFAQAQQLLEKITADQPELAGPWINLGQVYVVQDRQDDARRAFEAAVNANPNNCAAYNQLGILSRQNGDFAAAEDHYQACLTRVPDYKDAYLNLGILYELYLGKLSEALNAYRQYQNLSDTEDRRVQGWVVDLERRLGV